MNPKRKIVLPLIALFVLFSGSLTACRSLLAKWGIDSDILIIANIIFFSISLIAFFMQQKALTNSNPNVFVRSVMGGMLIKMFVVIIAVVVYRLVAGNQVSKVSVFAAMFLYLIYLGVEVAVITKLNRKQHG
jgi:lysylphosphatidylglycerol synthetase-like protein (DUF2156 family)